MIRHVSIPAKEPARVAKVLAELMQGRAFPFPGGVRASFMAVSGDAAGTMIEVYPHTMMGRPGEGEAPATEAVNPAPPAHWPFHLLMSTPCTADEVLAIGERAGWRTKRFGRGAPGRPPLFEVIEVWVEDSVLIEVAPEAMIGAYERTTQFEFLQQAGISPL